MSKPLRISSPPATYFSVDSLLHRANPMAKFLSLVVFLVTIAVTVKTVAAALCTTVVVGVFYVIAKIPAVVALKQLAPPAIVLVGLAAMVWWRADGATAAVNFLVLFSSVAAAVLLTLTTRISQLQDVFSMLLSPLAYLKVPVGRVALALSLTIRMIPMFSAIITEIVEAQKARGAGFSLKAFGVPVVVRTLLQARDVGEALVARGVDDES